MSAEAHLVAADATAADTPPPLNASSSTSLAALSLPPGPTTTLTSSSGGVTSTIPTWLTLKANAPALLTASNVPTLDSGSSPFERPFHIDGLQLDATTRAAKKAAREAQQMTVEEFNSKLGTATLQIAEGEEWLLSSGRKRYCREGTPCFDANHTVDQNGSKRAPHALGSHLMSCPQRRHLEVQQALMKGVRVGRIRKREQEQLDSEAGAAPKRLAGSLTGPSS